MQTSGLAHDFACPSCGYNLRGLLGDPLRCPECGQSTPVPDEFIPSLLLRQEHERLGNELATTCGVLGLALGLSAGLVVELVRGADFAGFCAFWMVVALAYWARGVWRFRTSCGAQCGWGTAFWRYQVWLLLWFVLTGAAVVLCAWVAPVVSSAAREGGAVVWPAALVAAFVLLAVFLALLQRGRDWASQSITELQRPLALARAREAWLRTSSKRREL